MNNRCIICVPIYKIELSKSEHLSLLRIIDFCLANNLFDNLIFIIPKNFDFLLFINKYIGEFETSKYHRNFEYNIITYDDDTFISLNAFNNMLLLSSNFYGDFNNYDYMLTYQLDAYIFDNQLEYFLNKNYDYIGGYYLPIYTQHTLYDDNIDINENHNLSMNGGFSLKNINFCLKCIQDHYLNYLKGCEFNNIHSYINEDTFFSLFYTTEVNALEAINFSLNWAAAESHYAINNFKYPFGCHGIDKSKFLMKLIKKYNKENNLDYAKYI